MKPQTAYHFGHLLPRIFMSALLLPGLLLTAQQPKPDQDEGPEPGVPYEGIRFPQCSGTNLRRHVAHLPEGFKDRYNLVMLSFGSEKDKNLDAWKNALSRIAMVDGAVGLYQVLVLEEFLKDSSYFIETGLTRRIGNVKEQEFVYVLYVNARRFQKQMGLENQNFHAMLVGRKGQIYWMAPGPFSPAQFKKMKEVVNALKAKTHAPTGH